VWGCPLRHGRAGAAAVRPRGEGVKLGWGYIKLLYKSSDILHNIQKIDSIPKYRTKLSTQMLSSIVEISFSSKEFV